MNRQPEPSRASVAWNSFERLAGSRRTNGIALARAGCWRIVLLLLQGIALHPAQTTRAQDLYSTDNELSPPEFNYYIHERNQRTAEEQQEQFRKRVSVQEAASDKVFQAYSLKRQARLPSPAPLPSLSKGELLMNAAGLIALILLARKLASDLSATINRKSNPWAQTAATVASLSAKVRAEDAAFSEFVTAFRMGPTVGDGQAASEIAGPPGRGLLMEFYARVPTTLAKLQQSVRAISLENQTVVRQKLLDELRGRLHTLKGEAGLPELLPVWQMASALEGLVKQLCDKASDANASTLRTIAAAVDLLKELSAPGLQADLLSNPPIRLMAVDDDLISRKAVAFALKKAFNAPDLAEHGEAALALAMVHAYDVIFLDVQMPGMDGYETCTRIHKTALNPNTPVVFVTCLSDFEGRAQSVLCGGNDLIGKPFLTFEITVKALTLAFHGRLTKRAQMAAEPEAACDSPLGRPLALKSTLHSYQQLLSDSEEVPPVEVPGIEFTTRLADGFLDFTEPRPRFPFPEPVLRPESPAAPSSASSEELLQAFLVRASTNLAPMRDLIQTIFRVTDDNVRQEMLADFFLRFNALASESVGPVEHPALRLSTALEGLLTKLIANPKNGTSSTLLTVATAMDLLIDLCDPAVRPDLLATPPIHLLVVDDDPVARRAVAGALQMTFEKPESVESGEAALALAKEKLFDAVFMDVEMPGMDGFAACLRIRQTEANRDTPVVFVTGHSDFKARSQSTISGGCDLIAKPFLPAEVRVKALTFVMRGRLHKDKSVHKRRLQPREDAPAAEELVPA
jgi:CheY-like chemotaxis protein